MPIRLCIRCGERSMMKKKAFSELCPDCRGKDKNRERSIRVGIALLESKIVILKEKLKEESP